MNRIILCYILLLSLQGYSQNYILSNRTSDDFRIRLNQDINAYFLMRTNGYDITQTDSGYIYDISVSINEIPISILQKHNSFNYLFNGNIPEATIQPLNKIRIFSNVILDLIINKNIYLKAIDLQEVFLSDLIEFIIKKTLNANDESIVSVNALYYKKNIGNEIMRTVYEVKINLKEKVNDENKYISNYNSKSYNKENFTVLCSFKDDSLRKEFSQKTKEKSVHLNRYIHIMDKQINEIGQIILSNQIIKPNEDLDISLHGKYEYFIANKHVIIPYDKWKTKVKNNYIILTDTDFSSVIVNNKDNKNQSINKNKIAKVVSKYRLGFKFKNGMIFNDFAAQNENVLYINGKQIVKPMEVENSSLIIYVSDVAVTINVDIDIYFKSGYNRFYNEKTLKIKYEEWSSYINPVRNEIIIPEEVFYSHNLINSECTLIFDLPYYLIEEILNNKTTFIINNREADFKYKDNQLSTKAIINNYNTIELYENNDQKYFKKNGQESINIQELEYRDGSRYLCEDNIKELLEPCLKIKYYFLDSFYGKYKNQLKLPEVIPLLTYKGSILSLIPDSIRKFNMFVESRQNNALYVNVTRNEHLVMIKNLPEKAIIREIEIEDKSFELQTHYFSKNENGAFKIYATRSNEINVTFRLGKPTRGYYYSTAPHYIYETSMNPGDNYIDINLFIDKIEPSQLVFLDLTEERNARTIRKILDNLAAELLKKSISNYTIVFGYEDNNMFLLNSNDEHFESKLREQLGEGNAPVHIYKNFNPNPLNTQIILQKIDNCLKIFGESDKNSFLNVEIYLTKKTATLLYPNRELELVRNISNNEFVSKCEIIKY